MAYITSSLLYNYIECPHKIWRDIYGPQQEKEIEVNPFVQLLWDKGVLHEDTIVKALGEFTDLSAGSYEERFKATLETMKKGVPLIYQGVLISGNLLGIPDLLRKNQDGTYIPIDIKSGRGLDGSDDEESEKYKKHYAVQLCHYVELLKLLGFAFQDKAIILDIHNNEIVYDLNSEISARNHQTWWNLYYDIRNQAQLLVDNKLVNKPAIAGACKLCNWYHSCKKWAITTHDPTSLFSLGRSKRDVIEQDLGVTAYDELININIPEILERKKTDSKFLYRIGQDTLQSIKTRAYMYANKSEPVFYKDIIFPIKQYELYFDIEDDPTQELVYLHGIYVRTSAEEKFVYFVAKDATEEAEKQAWLEFWEYIRSLPANDYAVYYYSAHEKTVYKKMRELYPDVVSEEELERFFDPETSIDLYSSVVLKYSDWPLGSYSVKEIAQYLNFRWRDATPSGALSIEWFNEYLKDKDPKKLERILIYNEDDCKAMLVIKDYIASRSKK